MFAKGIKMVMAISIVMALSAPAVAEGVSSEKLAEAGWICFQPPNQSFVACFNPGTGRPFPGNPDPRPTYSFKRFDLTTDEMIATGHMVREDLFRGQPCGTGEYRYIALIGYYECVQEH